MALCTAIQLIGLANREGLECQVVIVGDDQAGHHPFTSWRASQGWLHVDGVIYALSQSHMLPYLQESSRQLFELAAPAFSPKIGYAMAMPTVAERVEQAFQICGIRHSRLTETQIRITLRDLTLPSDTAVFKTEDRAIDLGVLMAILRRECDMRGAVQINAEVARMEAEGDAIRELVLADGARIRVGAQDQVLICAGPRSRKLLQNSSNVTCPSELRLFQSALISVPARHPLLAAYVGGGPTIVPTNIGGEVRAVLGNAQRTELFSSEVDEALIPEQSEQIREDVRTYFGIETRREDILAWAGVKAEFVPLGESHSQSHGIRSLHGVTNGWLGLPGKLSQAMSAGTDLARAALARRFGSEPPVREPLPRATEKRVPAGVA